MWRKLASIRRNLHNMKKSRRVADESMFGDADRAALPNLEPEALDGVSVTGATFLGFLSLLSCFYHSGGGGGGGGSSVDGAWASGEFARAAEMNHLMVSDGMRYAILM